MPRANDQTRHVLEKWLRSEGSTAYKQARDVKFSTVQLQQRLGQNKFRAEMMEAYEGPVPSVAAQRTSHFKRATSDRFPLVVGMRLRTVSC